MISNRDYISQSDLSYLQRLIHEVDQEIVNSLTRQVDKEPVLSQSARIKFLNLEDKLKEIRHAASRATDKRRAAGKAHFLE